MQRSTHAYLHQLQQSLDEAAGHSCSFDEWSEGGQRDVVI